MLRRSATVKDNSNQYSAHRKGHKLHVIATLQVEVLYRDIKAGLSIAQVTSSEFSLIKLKNNFDLCVYVYMCLGHHNVYDHLQSLDLSSSYLKRRKKHSKKPQNHLYYNIIFHEIILSYMSKSMK